MNLASWSNASFVNFMTYTVLSEVSASRKWAETLAGNSIAHNRPSIMPAMKAAQFTLSFDDINLLHGSSSRIQYSSSSSELCSRPAADLLNSSFQT